MKTHRIMLSIAALAGLSVLSAPMPASAESAVKKQLLELEDEQAMDEYLNPTDADKAKQEAKTNLPAELAQACLVPRVDFSGGHFSDRNDDEGTARFTAPLVFSRDPAFAKRIARLAKALGARATAPRMVCFSAPDGATERFNVSKTGEAMLEKLLSVSGIDPIPMHHAQMNGRVVVLSEERVGETLYGTLRKLADGGRAEVSLSLSPLPQWQPVRLSLTTTEGQRVTIPVELDGADRKLEIAAGTLWVVDGVETPIAFDKTQLGQIVLLAELVRRGNLKLTELTKSDRYPVSRTVLPESLRYTFHLLGANSAWFGKVEHLIQPKMTVRHTAGACSLAVDFESDNEPVVDLGSWPIWVWNDLSSVKPAAAGLTEMVVGYLTPPKCASDEGGVSAEEFDMLMELPKNCAALCNSVARAAKAIPDLVKEGKVITQGLPALSFSASTCQATCMEMSEYRQCLTRQVKGNHRDAHQGLAHCEGRRKVTR